MKHFALIALLATPILATSLPAQAGAQQEKMKACNAESKAKALKGDERKAFMKSCLSAGKDAAPAAEPAVSETKPKDAKERMKWCNVKAKGMKGADRKSFMSSCLKADPA